MRLYEKALPAMDEAEPDGAMDDIVVPGNPEIFVSDLQAPDLVVAHTIILGQYDFDGVTSNLELSAQAVDHISETPDLGDWGTFRCEHHDVHGKNLGSLVFRVSPTHPIKAFLKPAANYTGRVDVPQGRKGPMLFCRCRWRSSNGKG